MFASHPCGPRGGIPISHATAWYSLVHALEGTAIRLFRRYRDFLDGVLSNDRIHAQSVLDGARRAGQKARQIARRCDVRGEGKFRRIFEAHADEEFRHFPATFPLFHRDKTFYNNKNLSR